MTELINYLNNHSWGAPTLRVAIIFVIFIFLWVAWKFTLIHLRKKWVESSLKLTVVPSENTKRLDTILNLFNAAVRILLFLLGLFMVLGELGVDLAPIIAGAGIIGVAVGFGSQNLVRDVISGFFIILEDQIRIGDSAAIDGKSGMVEKINFRTIVLRDMEGAVHFIPNGSIQVVSNKSKDWSAAVFDIGVAYKEDVNRVIEVMIRVGADLEKNSEYSTKIISPLEIFGLDKFADSAVIIKARFKTKPLAQWAVGREYKRLLKMAFDLEGIEIPFPYTSISFAKSSAVVPVELKK